MILKKVSKKQGWFCPWPFCMWGINMTNTRIFYSLAIPQMLVLPPPPTISQTCELLGSQCTNANCMKKCFFLKSAAYLRSHIFATKRPTDKIKYSLETPFLFRFFIFYDFLNLNKVFRANLQCKSCVQLPILWKKCVFLKLWGTISLQWNVRQTK